MKFEMGRADAYEDNDGTLLMPDEVEELSRWEYDERGIIIWSGEWTGGSGVSHRERQ